MSPEDFEQKLQRQTIRQVPTEWRERILSAAQGGYGAPSGLKGQAFRRLFLSPASLVSTFLWPSPKAWAGLAAVWLGILALNFANADHTEALAQRRSLPPETLITLKQQEQLLSELLPPNPPSPTPPKVAVPQPRSERRKETAAMAIT